VKAGFELRAIRVDPFPMDLSCRRSDCGGTEDLSTKALVPTMTGVPIALGHVALFSQSVPIQPAWCHRLWPKLAKAADMKYIKAGTS
jgi:hypothetical protein